MTHYEVTLYRDEPGEAAVDSKVLKQHPTAPAAAIALARSNFDGYWNVATVDEGHMVKRRYRELPWPVPEWVDDETWRWYVLPDAVDREYRR